MAAEEDGRVPGQLTLLPLPFAPLCSVCGLRSARPHYAVGFWNTCHRCARHPSRQRPRQTRRPRHLAPCRICAQPRTSTRPGLLACCSNPCRLELTKQRRRTLKARVLRALGNHCVCPGCAWHAGPCTVSNLALLEVDHVRSDGHLVRRRSGRRGRVNGPVPGHLAYSRYARALRLPDHGMQLLCANCHRAVTHARRLEKLKKS